MAHGLEEKSAKITTGDRKHACTLPFQRTGLAILRTGQYSRISEKDKLWIEDRQHTMGSPERRSDGVLSTNPGDAQRCIGQSRIEVKLEHILYCDGLKQV